jgi:ABC-type phosphate transport system substrate-binding protein
MMKTLIKFLAAAIVFSFSTICLAELVVVVHPSQTVTSLSEDDVSRIFLGKSRSFPNGERAIPVNQDEKSGARATFNELVCKKSASQYKSHWAKLVFTGKGTMPKEVSDSAGVKALVAANPNMVGYIDSKEVDASVKVVFKLP